MTRIRDRMTREVTSASEHDSLGLASQMMLWRGARHLPVTREGSVVGILSERDVLRAPRGIDGRMHGTVGELMTRDVVVAGPDEDLATAAARMADRRIGCLPVVEDGSLVGILTTTDVLAHATDLEMRVRGHGPTCGSIARPAPIAHTGELLLDVVHRMASSRSGPLVVVMDGDRPAGVVTEKELRRAVGNPMPASEHGRAATMRIAEALGGGAAKVAAEAPIEAALLPLLDPRCPAAIVVDDDGSLVGVITYLDVLEALTGELLRTRVTAISAE